MEEKDLTPKILDSNSATTTKKSKKENVQPKRFTHKTHGKDVRQLVPPAGKETVMLEFK
jgi:hypothetical protein